MDAAGAVGPHGFDGDMAMAEHHPGRVSLRVRASSPIDAARILLPVPESSGCVLRLIIDRRTSLAHSDASTVKACHWSTARRIVVPRFLLSCTDDKPSLTVSSTRV